MSLKHRLLPTARRLRPLVSLPNEYRARSALYRAVPVTSAARHGSVFHCCTWKTGSQWVRLVTTDPRIYRHTGLRIDLLGERDGTVFRHRGGAARPNRLATPLYGTPAQFDDLRLPGEQYRCFFVIRDPRDLLVSWYFSNRYRHPGNPAVMRRRRRLAELSEQDGLLDQLGNDFGVVLDMLGQWASRADTDENVQLVRYEDLAGPDGDQHWAELFGFCGMAVPETTRRRVLGTYSFEKLSGGRRPSEEDSGAKYRKGTSGDWVQHFTPAVQAEFEDRCPDLVARLGYDQP